MSDEIVQGNSGEGQGSGEGNGTGREPGELAAQGSAAGQISGQAPVVQQVSEGGVAGEVGVEEFVVALSPKQQAVLREILATGNMSEASRKTGVGRTTIYDWMNGDERFEAALNAWKREVMRVSRAQAVGLSKPCVDAVRTAVENGDADLAFKVGKSMGVFAPPKVGPDDPAEVKMRKARKAKARKVKNARKEREGVEGEGEKLKCVKTIYEMNGWIEHLMLERMRAVQREEAGEKVARERNQRVLRKGDQQLERIARAIRLGSGEKPE